VPGRARNTNSLEIICGMTGLRLTCGNLLSSKSFIFFPGLLKPAEDLLTSLVNSSSPYFTLLCKPKATMRIKSDVCSGVLKGTKGVHTSLAKGGVSGEIDGPIPPRCQLIAIF